MHNTMAFRNDSPISVWDDRILVLHIDLTQWTSDFKTTEEFCHPMTMVSDSDGIDFTKLSRAPSMTMEEQECFPLPPFHDMQCHSQDEHTADESNSLFFGQSPSDGNVDMPTYIEVPDEHNALLNQLRQELYEEKSCLQLTFDGAACMCHDSFPDFSEALHRKKKKSMSPRKKSKRDIVRGRLLNLMHHAQ